MHVFLNFRFSEDQEYRLANCFVQTEFVCSLMNMWDGRGDQGLLVGGMTTEYRCDGYDDYGVLYSVQVGWVG